MHLKLLNDKIDKKLKNTRPMNFTFQSTIRFKTEVFNPITYNPKSEQEFKRMALNLISHFLNNN